MSGRTGGTTAAAAGRASRTPAPAVLTRAAAPVAWSRRRRLKAEDDMGETPVGGGGETVDPVRAGTAVLSDLAELPLLIGAVPVGVLHDVSAVGGRRALHLDGLAAVAVDQLDVAVDGLEAELLVGGVVVGPLHDHAAVRGGGAGDVQDLAGQPGLEAVETAAGVDELPLLLIAVVPAPLGDPGAVGGGQVVDVDRPAAVAVDQHVPGAGVHGRAAASPVAGVELVEH